jgi:hypothetical protein
MNIDELVSAFQQLPEDEQLALFKRIMPTVCELFQSDPQRMMAEMMPLCREMMQGCGIDPQAMMSMMAKMNK